MTELLEQNDEYTWIEQTNNGDLAAFNNVILKYQRPIYNLCYRMLSDTMEAEDAAQEIFVRAFFKLHTYDEKRSKFSTWLFSIASHYCIDRLRPRRFSLVSWDDLSTFYRFPAQDTSQPESALLRSETVKEVQQLLNVLPPEYRAAVVLKYWQFRSYEEIAQILGTTVGAIKSRLFRARKMMATVSTQQKATVTESGRLTFAAG